MLVSCCVADVVIGNSRYLYWSRFIAGEIHVRWYILSIFFDIFYVLLFCHSGEPVKRTQEHT